jgi:3-oxoacyl-[acyl-carrier protein] reductase
MIHPALPYNPLCMPVTLDLNGKVALITGGSRGIGAACVRMFREAGAKVAFNYQKAADTAEKLAHGCGAESTLAVQADLDGSGAEQSLVAAAVKKFSRLDILVVNHGIWPAHDQPIESMPAEQWHKTVAINLDSTFLLVREAVAQMKRQGVGGHVVLVSSTAGQRGEAFHADYAATKGAVISLVKGLSTELAPDKIYVNCVAPGWVSTDMTRDVLASPEWRDKIPKVIPVGRPAHPEEIAAPILFLCTKHAGFITGEVFNVNGGAVLVG